MPEIPLHGRSVSASWVVDALREAGSATADTLCGVEPEALRAGSGVFGELTRLRMIYKRPACGDPGRDPEALILKMPSESPANRARALAFRLYEREVRFYQEIAPSLDLRVPRCYWSRYDSESQRGALLLEDLGHLEAGDLLVGISPARATVAVERLARAHAQWWESPRLGALTWMPALDAPAMNRLAQIYRDLWPAFVDRRGHFLPPGSLQLGERVRDGFEQLLAALSRPPITVAHVDFRVDNLCFDHPRTANPVAVLDWQLVSLGRGAFDVAYLLSQSMKSAQRRRHEIVILASWHQALVRCGVTGYSFDDAIADYRRSALVCLGCAVAGTTLDRAGQRGNAIARAQAVRSFTAALDLDEGALVTKPLL